MTKQRAESAPKHKEGCPALWTPSDDGYTGSYTVEECTCSPTPNTLEPKPVAAPVEQWMRDAEKECLMHPNTGTISQIIARHYAQREKTTADERWSDIKPKNRLVAAIEHSNKYGRMTLPQLMDALDKSDAEISSLKATIELAKSTLECVKAEFAAQLAEANKRSQSYEIKLEGYFKLWQESAALVERMREALDEAKVSLCGHKDREAWEKCRVALTLPASQALVEHDAALLNGIQESIDSFRWSGPSWTIVSGIKSILQDSIDRLQAQAAPTANTDTKAKEQQ
jgi:hypothetical protein